MFEALEKIEFNFGQEIMTAGKAKLLFCYEVGVENNSAYVIALSANCGAVVFNIPDELAEQISGRAKQKGITFKDYVFRLVERYNDFETLSEAISNFGMGCDAAGEALVNLAKTHAPEPEKTAVTIIPNNWLKYHGYPMRRKGRGKKK
jgi:hypothetical protein